MVPKREADVEHVEKVYVYEPKPTLATEILLGTSEEAEKLRLLHKKYMLEVGCIRNAE